MIDSVEKSLYVSLCIAETPVPIQFTPFLGILAGAVVTLLGTSQNLALPLTIPNKILNNSYPILHISSILMNTDHFSKTLLFAKIVCNSSCNITA